MQNLLMHLFKCCGYCYADSQWSGWIHITKTNRIYDCRSSAHNEAASVIYGGKKTTLFGHREFKINRRTTTVTVRARKHLLPPPLLNKMGKYVTIVTSFWFSHSFCKHNAIFITRDNISRQVVVTIFFCKSACMYFVI